jgi:HEAT repeat protein
VLALGIVGCTKAQDKKTVEQWIAALKDKDWKEITSAAIALGKIGPGAANRAIPALIQLSRDDRINLLSDENIRKAAKEALKQIRKK